VGVFEEAHGGTLLLDEIGLTSQACQGKLLRVLETGEIRRVGASRELRVDVRVLSATNESLQHLAESKRFRQDLMFRLNVVVLRTPALRERRQDIPLLSFHFAQHYARDAEKPFQALSDEALARLLSHSFPGNVRELRNIVERAVVFSRGPVIRVSDLSLAAPASTDEPGALDGPTSSLPASAAGGGLGVLSTHADSEPGLDDRLQALERSLLNQALSLAGGNRSHAARMLKIKRTTLLQKIARYGLGGDDRPTQGPASGLGAS
jgi:DNA-binding NtrC family response regulator